MSKPETDMVCQWVWTETYFDEDVKEKRDINHCTALSNYRVTIYSNRQIMNDKGEWEQEKRHEEYLCKKHFDELYKYRAKPINPIFTYRKIERKADEKKVKTSKSKEVET